LTPQGEENDIILLSLVRSNDEGKIGFLSVAGRVCVALSRAKVAMVIVGNVDELAQRSRDQCYDFRTYFRRKKRVKIGYFYSFIEALHKNYIKILRKKSVGKIA
jgi:superfamily I DNA and/or RNA helicase